MEALLEEKDSAHKTHMQKVLAVTKLIVFFPPLLAKNQTLLNQRASALLLKLFKTKSSSVS